MQLVQAQQIWSLQRAQRRASVLRFAGVGLKNVRMLGTGQAAYFSESCLHIGINWGIVASHDILPSYRVHREINTAANKLQPKYLLGGTAHLFNISFSP